MKTSLFAIVAATALLGASGVVLAQSSARSIWDGAYTTAQAERGKTAYGNNCARCHGSSLEGNDEIPALASAHLMVDFDGQTAGDLVHRIQTTMPMDNPGTLNMKTVTDIATYILQSNQVPANADGLNSVASSCPAARPCITPA